MELIEALPQRHRDEIIDYIETYGDNSISVSASFNHLFRFWNVNKQTLFKLLGNKMILSKKIEINRPDSLIEDELDETLFWPDGEGYKFSIAFTNWVNDYYAASKRREYADDIFEVRSLIDVESLRDNFYHGENIEIEVPGRNHKIQIQHGCKVIRALSKIASAFDLPGFENFRLAHSRVLNVKILKGELCLSIHPLDYFTMSDNDCGWDSCMSWTDGGEYRLGTVEMMNSKYVVVAYLKAEKDFNWGFQNNHTWNNKKWRELFIVSEDMIGGIRPYPFDSSDLEKITANWIRELAITNLGWNFEADQRTYLNNRTNTFNGTNQYISWIFRIMYNDLYGNKLAYFNPDSIDICHTISGQTECMFCGMDWSDDSEDFDSGSISCPRCNHLCKCSACGEFDDEDNCEWVEDECLCSWCTERLTTYCEVCNDLVYTSHTTNYYMTDVCGNFDKGILNNHITVCNYCRDSQEFQKSFGPSYTRRFAPFGALYHVVQPQNFNDFGFECFGINDEEDRQEYKKFFIDEKE